MFQKICIYEKKAVNLRRFCVRVCRVPIYEAEFMINRTMVRTRVIQTLFAYHQDKDKTKLTAKKELLKSFADTYDLYVILLDFANELTRYAQRQMEEQIARARATHSDWQPNRRFVENRLAQQLFENRALRSRMEEQKMRWDSGIPAVCDIYKQLTESDFYREYMSAPECTYEQDKTLWRKIYQHLLPNNAALQDALDEMEVVLDKTNWTTDLEVILSFVVKTIKRFKEDSTPETPLLPMFDSEEELHFATDLLEAAIKGHEEYEKQINAHLKGWDADRIAYMDRIIIETALAEIIEFPQIALTVSMNEYIELGKEYSGEKSNLFINGILTQILKEMKDENALMKAATLK